VVVAAIWAVTFVVTRRLVQRLRYLEEFLRICAWCKKIDLGNEWGSLETYFDAKLNTKTTHGICPTCAANSEKRSAFSRTSRRCRTRTKSVRRAAFCLSGKP